MEKIHSSFFLLLLSVCIMTFLVSVWRIPCFLSSCCLAVRHALILVRPFANQRTFSLTEPFFFFCLCLWFHCFTDFKNLYGCHHQRAEESLLALRCTLRHWDQLNNILMTNSKYCWELNERIIDQNWIVGGCALQ